MSIYQYFALFSLGIAAITAAILCWKLRARLGHSEGMAISMLFGMLTGLAGGTALGTSFHGNLYASTLFAMFFGASVGMASVLPLGIMASLEGFAGGLMGGMMGAMLGEMVSTSQSMKLVNILIMLTFSSLLLFGVLSSRPDNGNFLPSKRWILKPISIFVLICGFLVAGSELAKQFDPETKGNYPEEHNH
ncbi:hypothetical protein [Bacillus sp. FJAT-27445]|uniref:hypothetical protein n=1 Tax=Bacillus sp. FJAT-27445 TaxID=1679166 RepID=UPI0007443722|nr:hypothetical protein [Bacillus sp. FJAT-27445]